jgi:hypothetical protein
MNSFVTANIAFPRAGRSSYVYKSDPGWSAGFGLGQGGVGVFNPQAFNKREQEEIFDDSPKKQKTITGYMAPQAKPALYNHQQPRANPHTITINRVLQETSSLKIVLINRNLRRINSLRNHLPSVNSPSLLETYPSANSQNHQQIDEGQHASVNHSHADQELSNQAR